MTYYPHDYPYKTTGNSSSFRVEQSLRLKLIHLLSVGAIRQSEAAIIAGVGSCTVQTWLTVRGIDIRRAREAYLKRILDLATEWVDD